MELDLIESSWRERIHRAAIDAGKASAGSLTADERVALARLRRENKQLLRGRTAREGDVKETRCRSSQNRTMPHGNTRACVSLPRFRGQVHLPLGASTIGVEVHILANLGVHESRASSVKDPLGSRRHLWPRETCEHDRRARDEAQSAITESIDNFSNAQRKHTTIADTVSNQVRVGLPNTLACRRRRLADCVGRGSTQRSAKVGQTLHGREARAPLTDCHARAARARRANHNPTPTEVIATLSALTPPVWRNWQTQRIQNPPPSKGLQVRFLSPALSKTPSNQVRFDGVFCCGFG